jgi:MFS family permease
VRLRGLLAAVAVDAGLLRRRRELRLLIAGQSVSEFGSQLTMVALPVQTYRLTGSTVQVGLIGLAEIVPILVLALVGGALADAFDRRRLVQLAEVAAALVAGGLVVNALLPSPHLWALYAAAALTAAAAAIRRPPLDALMPRLVPREELKAATALSWGTMELSTVGGPALAGVLISGAGLATAYAVDAVTFLLSLAALAAMRTQPPPTDAERPSLRGVVEGIRYARSRQELVGTYVVDVVAMFFGMPLALFPALAEGFGAPGAVGLLYAAPGAGALIAMLTSGWTARVHRHGRAVVLAACGWGMGIVLFGLAPSLWPALAALALAGAMDAVSGVFRGTIWNETIPDRMRGRLAGVEMLSWSSGPALGNVEAGLAASLVGIRASVVGGGVLCVAGALALAAALPGFRRYDARAVAGALPVHHDAGARALP